MVSDGSVPCACCLDWYVLRRSPFVVHMRIPWLDVVVTPFPTMNVAMTHDPSPGAVQRPSKRPRCDGIPPQATPSWSHAFVFAYVRGHLDPVRFELHWWDHHDLPIRQVSYNRRCLHGEWTFLEGSEGEPNVFVVSFNAQPERVTREHRFVQIAETNVYRYIANDPAWQVILIHLPEESW